MRERSSFLVLLLLVSVQIVLSAKNPDVEEALKLVNQDTHKQMLWEIFEKIGDGNVDWVAEVSDVINTKYKDDAPTLLKFVAALESKKIPAGQIKESVKPGFSLFGDGKKSKKDDGKSESGSGGAGGGGMDSGALGQIIIGSFLGGAVGSVVGASTVGVSGGDLGPSVRMQHLGAGLFGGLSVAMQLKKDALLSWAHEEGFDKKKDIISLDSNLRMSFARQHMQGGIISGVVGAGILSIFTASSDQDGSSGSLSSSSTSSGSSGGDKGNKGSNDAAKGGQGAGAGPPAPVVMSGNLAFLHNALAGAAGAAVAGYFAPEIVTYGGAVGSAVKKGAAAAKKAAGNAVSDTKTFAKEMTKDTKLGAKVNKAMDKVDKDQKKRKEDEQKKDKKKE